MEFSISLSSSRLFAVSKKLINRDDGMDDTSRFAMVKNAVCSIQRRSSLSSPGTKETARRITIPYATWRGIPRSAESWDRRTLR